MITDFEILETTRMFNEQHLDIRTITMGISLTDCAALLLKSPVTKYITKLLAMLADWSR